MNFFEWIFLEGLPLWGGKVVQPQKGTFPNPELFDNYYLLAFTENLKNTPKKRLFFVSVTNNNFEN